MKQLLKELEELKEQQTMIMKAKNLDVYALNIINKRMFEIREELRKRRKLTQEGKH